MLMGVGGVDVFGAEAEADHASGDAAEDGEMLQKEEREGQALEWGFGGWRGIDEGVCGRRSELLGSCGWGIRGGPGHDAARRRRIRQHLDYGDCRKGWWRGRGR